MDCDKFKIQIIDYIDGILSPQDAKLLEEHLQTCNVCKEELEETKQLLEHISLSENEAPSTSLKTGFYKMLDDEKDKQMGITKVEPEIVQFRDEYQQENSKIRSLNFYRVAAAVAILFVGFLTGYMFNPNKAGDNDKVASLQSEMNEMKTMFFAQLTEESASKRLEAVEKLEQYSKPDARVTNSLIKTMNEDENINVRTAAANALSKYAHDEDVRNALINALDKQKDPLMQITLINILVEINDQRAIEPMSQLVFNDSTMDVVRTHAEQGISLIAK